MSVDAGALLGLTLLVVGAAGGVYLRSKRAGSWVAGGTAVLFLLGGVLALLVLSASNPYQDGGTIAHYHAERVLGVPLAIVQLYTGLILFYCGQLPLGIVIGTALVFRREPYGWLRLSLACMAVPAVFYGALWMIMLL